MLSPATRTRVYSFLESGVHASNRLSCRVEELPLRSPCPNDATCVPFDVSGAALAIPPHASACRRVFRQPLAALTSWNSSALRLYRFNPAKLWIEKREVNGESQERKSKWLNSSSLLSSDCFVRGSNHVIVSLKVSCLLCCLFWNR